MDTKNRGTNTKKRGIDTKNRGKQAKIVPPSDRKPMPQQLIDTPVKDLSDREFLWFYKLKATNLTPHQIIKQTNVTRHFMVGTVPVSNSVGIAPKISKSKARKIRRANNKLAQLVAMNAKNPAKDMAINVAFSTNFGLRITVNNPKKTRSIKRQVAKIPTEDQAKAP